MDIFVAPHSFAYICITNGAIATHSDKNSWRKLMLLPIAYNTNSMDIRDMVIVTHFD